MEATSVLPSPILHRKWTAISAVAAALERKVWIRTYENLYPNQFILLVGPPGVGKSVGMSVVRRMWEVLDDLHLAPSSLTRASIIDALNDAARRVVRTSKGADILSFNSLYILSSELTVMLPAYETEFMSKLTDIYDGVPYGERRRGRDFNVQMKEPQINLLGATTPSALTGLLPEGAWDQGFLSRTILIYADERTKIDMFNVPQASETELKALRTDLRRLTSMSGKMTFTSEAAAAITAWDMEDGPPRPDHPKLVHYCSRRTAHLLKLCMVASAACGESYSIDIHHYQMALDWLLEAEASMPDIFRAMSQRGGDSEVIRETWHYVYTIWMKEKKPIRENRLVMFLAERVPSTHIQYVIKAMVDSGMLKSVSTGIADPKAYQPTKMREL